MPIRVPLLFHFNQSLSEDAFYASRTCYRGLLRVLRSHPNVPVNIHVSGTLVHALQWMDPEPLQLIWEGLRAGQFELLGSTYAQNVPYASDDWDNERQIALHQEVLHEVFGVTPVTFWNPARAWRQSLLPIIASAGYRFTLIEDQILAQAKLAEPVVVTSQVGAHILTLLYDDHLLRHIFNFAVWFGRPRQLQSYLLQRAEHPNSAGHCLTYAGNAEAMGLWGWREGVVPNQTWHRLDQILTLLEALPEMELIHLTNAPPSAGNLSPVPSGAAAWMDEALQDPDHRHHEPGFEDWFDFNEKSPKLQHFRDFYGDIREELKVLQEKVEGEPEEKVEDKKGPRRIFKAALDNFLSHQYEFGRVGVGGEGFQAWEGAAASWALMQTARWALKPQALVLSRDVTCDDRDEFVLSDGQDLIITTPAGGRLLYWFDLHSGRQYVGNQRAVTKTEYGGDAALPVIEKREFHYWLPDDSRPQAIVPEARLTAEAAPTRLGRYLPEWIWEGEREPFELLSREIRLPDGHMPLAAQRRAFVDYIAADGESVGEPGEWLEATIEGDGVTYQRNVTSEITLRKHYAFSDGDISVTYEWQNSGSTAVEITWKVLTEVTPGYDAMLDEGRPALEFITTNSDRPGVRNNVTREEVRLVPDRIPDEVEVREVMLSLEIALTFLLTVEADGEERMEISLHRQPVSGEDERH